MSAAGPVGPNSPATDGRGQPMPGGPWDDSWKWLMLLVAVAPLVSGIYHAIKDYRHKRAHSTADSASDVRPLGPARGD